MGIFSNIFRNRKKSREGNLNVTTGYRGAVTFGSGAPVPVTGDSALEVTAYKRALDVLSGSVARLPFRFCKRQGGIYVDFESSPLHYLLTVQPMMRMSAFDFKYQLVWRGFHDGDAYIYPRFIDGELAELVLLSRHSCAYDEMNGKYYVNDAFNGVSGDFNESQILHIVFNSTDGRKGTPLWQIGARALSIIATGDRETLERFDKGGIIRGVLTNAQTLQRGMGEYSVPEMTNLASDVDQRFQSGERVVALPGDVSYIPVSSTSADLQFLDSRKFAVNEIARLTGVPPMYLFDMTGSNYKMPEQADTAYLTQTLDRILTAIEGEFQRKLVSQSMCCKRIFKFDRKAIYAMDLSAMADYEAKMIQNGTLTVNDVRRMENQPPVEGGDLVYLSTNLAEIGSEKLRKTQEQDSEG